MTMVTRDEKREVTQYRVIHHYDIGNSSLADKDRLKLWKGGLCTPPRTVSGSPIMATSDVQRQSIRKDFWEESTIHHNELSLSLYIYGTRTPSHKSGKK